MNVVPNNSMIEITGQFLNKNRNDIYSNMEKRIFFMTPQTLENDLIEKKIDPSKIVLIIFGNIQDY